MNRLPDLLRQVLRTFCYAEWYELSVLAGIVERGDADFDVGQMRKELDLVIEAVEVPFEELNEVTGLGFEDSKEARRWLEEVRTTVFR